MQEEKNTNVHVDKDWVSIEEDMGKQGRAEEPEKGSEKKEKDMNYAKNPDPRANENLPEDEKRDKNEGGVGSEITDGGGG